MKNVLELYLDHPPIFYRWVEFYIFDRAFWTFVLIHSFRNIHLNDFDTLVGFCQSVKQTSNFRWNQSIDFSSCVCCTAKCRCCQCYLSLTVKKSHGWSNIFSSMKNPFCLWWGLTGYRPTGSETRNDSRSSSENNARLKDESACDTSARFAFPSITGNKMSFPSFPLQNFRGALSLSLSLRSRACACSLIVRSLFFLCTILKASVVESPPCFASILGSHTVNSCRRESFCSSFCLLFTFALLCLFFL